MHKIVFILYCVAKVLSVRCVSSEISFASFLVDAKGLVRGLLSWISLVKQFTTSDIIS